MATHSSTLAWGLPWTEEPGGLQSVGHKESDMNERLSTHNHPTGKRAPGALSLAPLPASHSWRFWHLCFQGLGGRAI